jgi:hypothetical protein
MSFTDMFAILGWFKPKRKSKNLWNALNSELPEKGCSVKFVGMSHVFAAAVKEENAREVSEYRKKLQEASFSSKGSSIETLDSRGIEPRSPG